jgi:predicted nucleic acid-binding protein
MIYSSRFTALIDACILYPVPVIDLLLILAEKNLYKPKWTHQIFNEFKSNLLKNRQDLTESQLDKRIAAMNDSFPEANVLYFEKLIEGLSLPDPKDRHVLAAAIRCQADVIITNNLRDFPKHYLQEFDIEAQSADDFIMNAIDLDPELVLQSFNEQVSKLKNPPKSKLEVLESLKKCLLIKTSERIKSLVC